MKRQLTAYCQAHQISKSEAIKQALDLLLTKNEHKLTPYELGHTGFGADKTQIGNIARNSKSLLRKNHV